MKRYILVVVLLALLVAGVWAVVFLLVFPHVGFVGITAQPTATILPIATQASVPTSIPTSTPISKPPTSAEAVAAIRAAQIILTGYDISDEDWTASLAGGRWFIQFCLPDRLCVYPDRKYTKCCARWIYLPELNAVQPMNEPARTFMGQ